MKRFTVAFSGFAFGLFLSWLCLYSFSHISWPVSNTSAQGCNDIEHCRKHWWTYPLFFGTLFGPAIFFGLLNAIAWRHWTAHKWVLVFGLFVVLTVTFYSLGYLVPLLRG